MKAEKTRKAPWVCTVAAIAALLLASPVWANVIGPGGSGPADVLTQGTATLLASTGTHSWTYTTTSGTTSGLALSEVFSDSANTFCAGCLDFVFFVFNNPTSVDALSRVTDSAFGTFMTDVGFLTNVSCPKGPNVDPTTVDRSINGNVAGFDYPGGTLAPGDCTSELVVETNATLFTAGDLSVIDSGVATVPSFAPTAVPEPASMALLGTALFGAYALLRRRMRSS